MVHPHACGELTGICAYTIVAVGSSPRMWGTLKEFTPEPHEYRFIPTHVGNSKKGFIRFTIELVHPHACGELGYSPAVTISLVGSSPRMWGTRLNIPVGSATIRFIPTHVGNSVTFFSSTSTGTVHPHACGELPMVCVSGRDTFGSSPRMWGTHPPPSDQLLQGWFIPTHVGNSSFVCPWNPSRMVHPHACGELEETKKYVFDGDGSSPRMWGTPYGVCFRPGYLWFIPTHVENSA